MWPLRPFRCSRGAPLTSLSLIIHCGARARDVGQPTEPRRAVPCYAPDSAGLLFHSLSLAPSRPLRPPDRPLAPQVIRLVFLKNYIMSHRHSGCVRVLPCVYRWRTGSKKLLFPRSCRYAGPTHRVAYVRVICPLYFRRATHGCPMLLHSSRSADIAPSAYLPRRKTRGRAIGEQRVAVKPKYTRDFLGGRATSRFSSGLLDGPVCSAICPHQRQPPSEALCAVCRSRRSETDA